MSNQHTEQGNFPIETNLVSVMAKAVVKALSKVPSPKAAYSITSLTSLKDLAAICIDNNLSIDKLLSQAALESYSIQHGPNSRSTRRSLQFILADRRPESDRIYTNDRTVRWALDATTIHSSISSANEAIELIDDLSTANNSPVFALLGLRNLSSFIGEVFASEVCRHHKGKLMANPNQDGYPDLLALTPDGTKYIAEREKNGEMSEKRYWSPYPYGGIEVKATCGNVPPAKTQAKPGMGDSRIPTLVSAEWKAHHRDTNNLLGIFWDFVDGLPTVLAAFYRNDLTVNDWGNIVQPKEGGGRTTSVSIMNRTGVKRMGTGWLVLPKNADLQRVLCQRKIFDISASDIRSVCTHP